jgi:2-polyprenyl-6-methoxyphenol hydroxylase-like FAD-dependent oxidoreductase
LIAFAQVRELTQNVSLTTDDGFENILLIMAANVDETALRTQVLENFKPFSPDLVRVLENINISKIKSWPQNDAPFVETWSSKRLVLVGDAAHPFLPCKWKPNEPSAEPSSQVLDEAQGSAHALEDAAAIAAVLPFGTTPDEIEGRLKVFQESRQRRVNHILNFTREIGKDNSTSKIERCG